MADKKTVDKVKELLDGHVYAPLKEAAEKWLAEAEEKYGDKIGDKISFLLMINDYDSTGALGSRIMISSDPVKGSNQWSVSQIGNIGFNYAPYTGDNTIYFVVVAMVAALAVAGVTVVALRRRVTSK